MKHALKVITREQRAPLSRQAKDFFFYSVYYLPYPRVAESLGVQLHELKEGAQGSQKNRRPSTDRTQQN
jgi:hypothetical protein